MTARPRQASGSAGALVSSPGNGSAAGAERSSFSWETWFRHANAHQRAEALQLAHQQGVVYPHQLSPTTHGAKTAEAASESETARTLALLLAGKAGPLAPFVPPTLTFFDTELDEVQQQAVLRALGTPDVFLLQGLPGTGKSRVTAEIIRQTAALGGRTLFLAAQPISLDVVLKRLVGVADVFALRYLDAAEKPDALPAWLRGFTLEEQRQSFLERILAGARENRLQVEASCQKRRDEEPAWSELRQCLEQIATLEQKLHDVAERLPRLSAIIEQEAQDAATPLSQQLAEARRRSAASIQKCEARLQTQRDTLTDLEQKIADINQRINALAPGYQAKKEKQFWSGSFWKHLFDGHILPEMDSLRAQLEAAQAQQRALQQAITHEQTEREHRQAQGDAECQQLLAVAIDARRYALTQEEQTLRQDCREQEQRWTTLCQRLAAHPLEATPAALESAQQSWLRARKLDEEQCQFARQWKEFVEETGPQLAARLPQLANVLAGTLANWPKQGTFHEAASGPFDLVLIEDGDTLTEADLLRMTAHAHRCVLIGQTLTESVPGAKRVEPAPRAFAGAPLTSALVWNKLWQALGGDAGIWPYSWSREQGQLICNLVPLAKEDRPHLQRECLADAAEIELRILHRPKCTPCLAQMVFPTTWSYPQALGFVYREAQELPIAPLGRSPWWTEDPQCCAWHTAASSWCVDHSHEIENGLRLGLRSETAGDAPALVRIEFDKSAGWDRVKAEAWLDRFRPGHDLGRTVFLQTPYRFAPLLTQTLVRIICASHWLAHTSPAAPASAHAFEFCAVPPLTCDSPKEGAGLELDLSATRHVDRLPAELRHGLPTRGYVNYLEALALVRRLETIVQEPCAKATTFSIAVLALYESQVELLRRLIARSPLLQERICALDVAMPSKLHQRECDVVLLSLTRSHTHRAGAFGENVQELAFALTRARSRLHVFGDAGMLAKRSHWLGPVDHHDAHTSAQEALRLSRLFACVQAQAKPLVAINGTSNGTRSVPTTHS